LPIDDGVELGGTWWPELGGVIDGGTPPGPMVLEGPEPGGPPALPGAILPILWDEFISELGVIIEV